jgi:hypothetical protein
MTKTASNTTITTVRNSKTGQFVTVKGAGALRGKMTISKKVDLTKPISVPAASRNWTQKVSGLTGKMSATGGAATSNSAKG